MYKARVSESPAFKEFEQLEQAVQWVQSELDPYLAPLDEFKVDVSAHERIHTVWICSPQGLRGQWGQVYTTERRGDRED
jgi:hypothetical protein